MVKHGSKNNLPDADGLILPRQKSKKMIIPTLLINCYKKEMELSGVGISVKGKTKVFVKEKEIK